MAASAIGTFKLIDEASSKLRTMREQAERTDAAFAKLGTTMALMSGNKPQQDMQKMEKQTKNLTEADKQYGKQLDYLRSKTSGLSDENNKLSRVSRDVSRAVTDVGRAAKTTERDLDSLTKKTQALTRAKNDLKKSVGLLSGAFGVLMKAMMPFAIGVGGGSLIQLVGALGGGIAGLLPQLGSLAGLLAPLPTLFTGMGLAMITVKLAFSDITKAMAGNKKALAALTPEGRKFLDVLKSYKPELKALRESAQKGLFPGLTQSLQTLKAGVPALQNILQMMGRTLGTGAANFSKFLVDPSFLKDFTFIAGQAALMMSKLFGAFQHIVSAIRNIMVAGAPFVRWLTDMVAGWAKAFDQMTMFARNDGRMSRMFAQWRIDLTQLGHIFLNLYDTIKNIISAARPLGNTLYAGMERTTKAWRDWTGSAGGQYQLIHGFELMHASIHQVVLILGDLGKALFQQGQSQTLPKTLAALRQVLDKLVVIFGKLANTYGPMVATLFNQIATTLGALTNTTGPIAILITGLTKALELFNKLAGVIPLLGTLLATAFAVFSVARIIGAVSGLARAWMSVFSAERLAGRQAGTTAAQITASAEVSATAVGGAAASTRAGGFFRPLFPRGAAAAEAGAARGAPYPLPFGMGGGTPRGAAPYPLPFGMGRAVASRPGFLGRAAGVGRGLLGKLGGGIASPGGLLTAGFLAQSVAPMLGGRGNAIVGALGNIGMAAGLGAEFGGPWGAVAAGGAMTAKEIYSAIRGGGGPNLDQRLQNNMMMGRAPTAHDVHLVQREFSGTSAVQPPVRRDMMGGILPPAYVAPHAILPLGVDPAYIGQLKREATAPPGASIRQTGASRGAAYAYAMRMQAAPTSAAMARQQIPWWVARQGQARTELQKATKAGDITGMTKSHDALALINEELAARRRLIKVIDQQSQTKATDKALKALQDLQTGMRIVEQHQGKAAALRYVGTESQKQMAGMSPAEKLAYGQRLRGYLSLPDIQKDPNLKKIADTIKNEIGGKLTWLQNHSKEVNQKIHEDSKTKWEQIKTAMTGPAADAARQVGISFSQLQTAAMGALMQMGYTQQQAISLFQMYASGGTPQYKTGSTAPTPAGTTTHHAAGGRLSGSGLQDTVPIPLGIGAPGELVVNRHTEGRVNGMLAAYGTSLGGEVGRETRRHSAPPMFAKGGRAAATTPSAGTSPSAGYTVGALGAAISEANRIDSLNNAGKLPYVFGGSHGGGTVGPMGPFDCSSAVSRVLEVAGLLGTTQVSSGFLHYGAAGQGPITVVARPGAGRAGHVYMMIGGRAWGTSNSNPGGGPGWISGGVRKGFVTRVPTGMVGNAMFGSVQLQPGTSGLHGYPGASADSAMGGEAFGMQTRLNQAIAAGGIMPGMARGGRLDWGGWFGEGGQLTARRPTMIGIGERGTETATITKGPVGAGGHTIHVQIDKIENHRAGDIEQHVKREIARAFDELAMEMDHGSVIESHRSLV